jgi:hypothetical protein
VNSYKQLVGGKHTNVAATWVSAGAVHATVGAVPGWSQNGTNTAPVSGWDLNTITSTGTADAINHYYFSVTNAPKGANFTATATLVWNRQSGQSSINNLGFFLYNIATGQLMASSTSLVDNVQHVYVPSLPAGAYDLQVWKAGGGFVSPSETYALAYEFFSSTATAALVGTNAVISWPLYPAGFLVEASTNVTLQNWVTFTNYTPVIVGSTYQLTVPAVNPNSITWITTTNVVSTNGINIGPAPITTGDATNVVTIPTYNNNLDLHYFRLRRPNL